MSSQVASITAAAAGTLNLGGEVTVNRLGFGAMRLTGPGIWGPPKDREAAIAVLRRAVELEVNFIDTADSYGPAVSEELIAEALHHYPKGFVIATKGGWNRPGPGQWTHDSSPKHLREAIEGSLKRLRLDCIELYQLHTPDPAISFDASIDTLAQLKAAGKIHFIGLSNVTESTSSARVELRKLFPCRIATACSTANGNTSSIIASRMKSRSFPGFRSAAEALAMTFCPTSRKRMA
jgi:pyridoxine 4-dehydrogenase